MWFDGESNNNAFTSGVSITDPMPAGNTYVSSTTQGTCTGGAILICDIGPMAAGDQVTITLITTPSTTGTQSNTAAMYSAPPSGCGVHAP